MEKTTKEQFYESLLRDFYIKAIDHNIAEAAWRLKMHIETALPKFASVIRGQYEFNEPKESE